MPDPRDVVDLGRPRRIHLVGAGGAGIGAMATVLVGMGHRVTGSDQAPSPMLDRIARQGVTTWIGHEPTHVADAELVAVSTAVGPDDPEVAEARRLGRPVLRRADLLAAICATRRTLAVSGTHGKTTTSALLALVLLHAGRRPSYIIGGDVIGLDGGAAWDPDGEWLVVEADESDGTFLELPAEGVLVTSVEADHLDYYGGEPAMRQAYAEFLAGAPGPRVVCADDPGARDAARASGRPCQTYGTSPGADVRIVDLAVDAERTRFTVRRGTETLGPVELAVPGAHFARNAAGALTLALAIGVDPAAARAALATYQGVRRRFERRGQAWGADLIDDYGHLPGEVQATLDTARQGGWSRVVAVFQPHRYSRTEALAGQFADAFAAADVLVVADVYPAGEPPRPGVTGRLIADAVRRAHPDAAVCYVADRDGLAAQVAALLRPGDVCVSLGAGDITRLPAELQELAR